MTRNSRNDHRQDGSSKRLKGRGRKQNNSANRSYESTGPDVKIRGSANHIYDKYQQYARDAQSSGDRVASENYLQHAEHYYRLMVANAPKERPQTEVQDPAKNDVANTVTVRESEIKIDNKTALPDAENKQNSENNSLVVMDSKMGENDLFTKTQQEDDTAKDEPVTRSNGNTDHDLSNGEVKRPRRRRYKAKEIDTAEQKISTIENEPTAIITGLTEQPDKTAPDQPET